MKLKNIALASLAMASFASMPQSSGLSGIGSSHWVKSQMNPKQIKARKRAKHAKKLKKHNKVY